MRTNQQRAFVPGRDWRPYLFATALILFFCVSTGRFAAMPAHSEQLAGQQVAHPKFAFWYEPWKEQTTFEKLARPQVVIGLAPSEVKSAQHSGARVLRYVTFYQSKLGQPFLKDQSDLPNVGVWDGDEFLTSIFGTDRYVLCPNSKVVHERAIAFLNETMLNRHYDGLFVDNTYPDPAAHTYCASRTHAHLLPGARGDDAWLELLAQVRQKLKAISPTAVLITNPGSLGWADRMGTGKYGNLWDLSDYVLWESFGYTSYRGREHDWWQRSIVTGFKILDAKRRKVIALSYPLDRGEALYSFVIARIFGLEWTANVGESEQGTEKEGGHFGAFLPGVPFDLGTPAASMEGMLGSDRISRKFEHGAAIANISDSPIRVLIPANVRLYVGDRVSDTASKSEVTLPRRTAAVYIYPVN